MKLDPYISQYMFVKTGTNYIDVEYAEDSSAYLRRSKKRILKGQKPFPVQLTFEVEAEEKGINIKKELNKKSSKLDK